MTNRKIDRALKKFLGFFCPGGKITPFGMIFDRAGRKNEKRDAKG
jgi:hypothetical protein